MTGRAASADSSFAQELDAQNTTIDAAPADIVASNEFGFRDAVELIWPDGIFVGGTFRTVAGGAGHFATYGINTGRWNTYNSQAIPFTKGFSMVGTVSLADIRQQEGGVNFSKRIPTPAGDALLFINVRQDALTVPGVAEALTGTSDDKVTVSLNLGFMYSVSDGAIKGLGAAAGGPIGAMVAAAATGIGPDAWVGLGWRASATIENGEIVSINISGHEIAADDLPGFLSSQREAVEDSNTPIIGPNYGRSDIASLNDTLLAIWGQSPWDIGLSAAETRPDGTLDVLNHGNSVTAITEPVYELASEYGTLPPDGRISSNAQAGEIIDETLTRISDTHGIVSVEMADAVSRLSNDYGLDFGSNMLRLLAPLDSDRSDPPVDYDFVRGVFAGAYREPADL